MLTNQRQTELACADVYYPAGEYAHSASGLLQIRMVRKGSSFATIDLGAGRRRMFTRPGDLLLSLPDRPTYFRIEDGRHLTLLQVGWQTAAAHLSVSGGAALAELEPLLAKPVRDPMLSELCRRVARNSDPAGPFCTSALVVVMLSLLAKARDAVSAVPANALSSQQLDELTAFVDAHIDEPLQVRDLADAAGANVKAFVRAFKAATSLPVYQFILRRRADLAVTLLRETTLALSDIALRAGFSHQAHMTRTLSKLRGQTPMEIRSATFRPQEGSPTQPPESPMISKPAK